MVNLAESNLPVGPAIGAVRSQLKQERQSLRLLRVSFIAVGFTWLLLIAWMLPGTPFARISDVNVALALGLLFAVLAFASTLVFWLLWRPLLDEEPARQFLRLLMGGGIAIRSSAQFSDALARECRLSERGRGGFSVLVVRGDGLADRRRPSSRPSSPTAAAMLIRALARDEDIVAEVSEEEAWVLARGALAADCDALLARYVRSLAQAGGSLLPGLADADIACVSYGADGTKPDELLSAARKGLAPVSSLAKMRTAA